MKWLIVLLFVSLYTYGLIKAADLGMLQVQHINETYTYVENNAGNIAAGQSIPPNLLTAPK
jgi:hypothetical protein